MQHKPAQIAKFELSKELHRWRTTNLAVDRVIERELKFQPSLKRYSSCRSSRLEKLAALRALYLSQANKEWSWMAATMFGRVIGWERWVVDNVELADPEFISVELIMVATVQRENICDEIASFCDLWREGVDPELFTVKDYRPDNHKS